MRLVPIAIVLLSFTRAPAVGVCIGPHSNGQMGTMDCSMEQYWPIHVRGYSQFDAPCEFGSCGSAPATGTEAYGWTISASDTDPYVQTGALSTPVARLYVWYVCAAGEEARAAEFGIENTDPNLTLIYVGQAPGSVWLVNYVPFGTDFVAYSGNCSPAPAIVGEIFFVNDTPVSVEAQSWGGVKSLYR